MDALLAIIAEHISRTTGDFCSVVLLSRDGRRIEPVAAFHPNPEVLEDAKQRVGVPMELDAAGPWKTVLTERRPIVVVIDPDHLPANLAPHQIRSIQRWRIREAVMIPMIAEDRVVGGLNLNRLEGSAPLSEEDIKLLETLARRAEELGAANHFLDSMIENIPNMIFVKDAKELRFVRLNRAGEDLLGFTRDELMGKNDFDFFSTEQAEHFVSLDRETLRSGRLVDIPEEVIQTKNKGARILHTKKIPILDAAGEPSFLLGISEDITEARKAQEAVRKAQEEAERANRAKSEFLASMSHELRTPLNAILGFSELLSDDSTDQFDTATRRRFLDQIHSSGQHLLQLINDILDLSKVEAGQMELQLRSVDLGSLIDEARETVEPLAQIKAIALDAEPGPELHLIADAAKVKQMLLNLLSNAIKFTPNGGSIQIRGRQVDSWVEIAVSDTGIGIAAEDLGRLFTEFLQLDAGPARQQEGTGLGLALTRRFAELHGGQVI